MQTNGAQPTHIVAIQGLNKVYGQSRVVFDNVDLYIQTGEFFVLLGKSGSGKSTLLNLISGIDQPDSGQICIGEHEITALDEKRRTRFRRDHIGIVFQFFNLIHTLTVLENVTLPLELGGAARQSSENRARALLERVGLTDRANSFPDKLSGGEQQRVALARALVHEPLLVLADEPTGNLDEDSGKNVLALLLELTRDLGKTLVMATHNAEIAPLADRVCRIQEGKLHVSLNSLRAPVAGA